MPLEVRRTPHVLHVDWWWIALQVAMVTAAVFVYFRVRGLTEGSPETAVANARDLMDVERATGLDVEDGLQDVLLHWDWLVAPANWVYMYGHWPVIAATLVWLAVRHRDRYVRLRDAMMISGGIGLFIFALYPVAPPRLAGLGIVDTVSERSIAYRVLQPPAFVNQYAAMPSLHAGWDLLVGLAIAGAAAYAWLRWAGYLLPVLMAAAVILTGNHFVLDVLAGIAVALVGLLAADAVDRHWRRPRAHLRPALGT
ncbi:MAG: phosphatase PAP2 family protein [Kineosporiaceae bacterium]